MKTTRHSRLLVAISLGAIILFLAVGRTPKPAGQTEASKAPAAPAVVTQGVVTYLDGKASVKAGADWKELGVGDAVPMSSSVRTEKASTCDIQFGTTGAVRIRAESVVELRTIALGAGKNAVDIGLTVGSVACKVNKLATRDRFQVLTGNTVCGVRGTRFAVSQEEGKPTKVAVEEGKVAVMPPSFDQAKLDAAAKGQDTAMVDAVVSQIVEAAPVVTANQELNVKAADLAKMDTIVASVQEELATTLAAQGAAAAPVSAAPAEQPQAAAAPAQPTAQSQPAAQPQAAASSAAQPQAATSAAQAAATPVVLPVSISQSLKQLAVVAAAAPASVQKPATLSTESKQILKESASLEVKPNPPEPKEAIATPVSAAPAAPTTVNLTVNATPRDAEILFDGKVSGRGTATQGFAVGTTVSVKVRHRGYADYEASIPLTGGKDVVQAAALKAEAIYGSTRASSAALVSGLVAAGENVFAADAKGGVIAFNDDGAVLWTAKTGNSENANSRPVLLASGALAFAGDKSLAVLEAGSGKLRFSVALSDASTGLFGRRPVASADKLYLATSSGIEVVSATSGASLGKIELPGDVEATPAVNGGSLYAVTVDGVLCVVDAEKKSLTAQIKTSAVQPIAAAVAVSGGKAYFVDRKGLAVCVDLGAQSVAWERRVDGAKNLNVLQDPVLGESALYVFAKGTVYALSLADGERLFALSGASSPPTLASGALWYGTLGGKIVAVDPVTGKTRATLSAPAKVVGVAAKAGELLAFPTESGEAVFADPAVALQ